jgi:endonuclease/exonuclease/phosphatase family metal-dependent hydrolase
MKQGVMLSGGLQIRTNDPAKAARSRRLKVVTYNVHRSIGTDGVHDPARTAEVIRETGAAILALQEVEDYSNDPQALARAGGMRAIPGPTITGPDSNYGNLLLTRLRVEQAQCLDLSWGKREARGVIDARLYTDEGACLRCLATHLGLTPRERVYQHRLLRRLLEDSWRGPTLLMGDFNEWYPCATTTRALNRLLGRSRAVRTFPSWLPLLPLDRIWIHPPHLLRSIQAWRTPCARRASDHLPLVAELGLSHKL